jgi:hypothetical protein
VYLPTYFEVLAYAFDLFPKYMLLSYPGLTRGEDAGRRGPLRTPLTCLFFQILFTLHVFFLLIFYKTMLYYSNLTYIPTLNTSEGQVPDTKADAIYPDQSSPNHWHTLTGHGALMICSRSCNLDTASCRTLCSAHSSHLVGLRCI